MNPSRVRLVWPVLACALLLPACRSIPEVTQVPVPTGPTVFHGGYTGQLTEALEIAAAAPSLDGAQLYAAAQTSGHTTLLTLDRATGREQRRVDVPVADPQDLAVRADGVLVLAGRKASATLDPATLSVLTPLPGAQRISADGERLLTEQEGGRVGRVRTRDGRVLPTTNLTLRWSQDGTAGVSRDLEWTATLDGNALINLSTGARIDTSTGHLNPCPGTSPYPVDTGGTALATSEEGFVLGRLDRTLEWRNWDGSLRAARWLGPSCQVYNVPDWELTARGTEVGYRLNEGRVGREGEITIGRWLPGGDPQVIAQTRETSGLPFRSTFALGQPEAYLQLIKLPARGLRLGGRWEQAYEPPHFPLTAQVSATYQDQAQYRVQGTLNALGGSYTLQGTGSHAAGEPGRIVFTQALCSVPPFGPNCPSTDWRADLLQGEQKMGSTYAYALDPNQTGSGRAVQEGAMGISLGGELRSFSFRLVPAAPQ